MSTRLVTLEFNPHKTSAQLPATTLHPAALTSAPNVTFGSGDGHQDKLRC